MQYAIVFRFLTIFVAGSLNNGLSPVEVEVVVLLGSFLARTFVVVPTGTDASTQTKVVDAESDRRKQQAEQNWDGPVDGVEVQAGLIFCMVASSLLALNRLIRVVPEQTDGSSDEPSPF